MLRLVGATAQHVHELPADYALPVLLPVAHPRLEHHKEPVVPHRVIPHVLIDHRVHEIELARPQRVVVVEREDPLAVRPRVVVFLVLLQNIRDKRELLPRLLREREDEPPVVPHLVRLEVLVRELVHQRDFGVQRPLDLHNRLVPVLPGRMQGDYSTAPGGYSERQGRPGRVVRGIQTDNVFCELQNALALLAGLDHRAQVIGCIPV